ncbi:hypothetical protein GOBAR_DD07234 [Gossypium barbadense]|nr:hypothetical protein GOBAR_DD07234 [Gossypium barbadense]
MKELDYITGDEKKLFHLDNHFEDNGGRVDGFVIHVSRGRYKRDVANVELEKSNRAREVLRLFYRSFGRDSRLLFD